MSANMRTLQEKQAFVKQFKESGKSLSAWCREQGIPTSTFSKWVEKFSSPQSQPVQFLCVRDSQQTTNSRESQTEPMLLLETGPYKLHIQESTSGRLLASVLEVLRHAAL